jgi:hypothetical protein
MVNVRVRVAPSRETVKQGALMIIIKGILAEHQ